MEQMYHASTNCNKWGVAILVSSRIDFKERKVIREREGYYIMMGSNFQNT